MVVKIKTRKAWDTMQRKLKGFAPKTIAVGIAKRSHETKKPFKAVKRGK